MKAEAGSCYGQQLDAYFVITVPKSSLNTAVSMVANIDSQRHLQESGLPTGSGQRVSILYHSSTFDILQMDGYLAYLKLSQSIRQINKFLSDLEKLSKGQMFNNSDIKFIGKQINQFAITRMLFKQKSFLNTTRQRAVVYISEGILKDLIQADKRYDQYNEHLALSFNQTASGPRDLMCKVEEKTVKTCVVLNTDPSYLSKFSKMDGNVMMFLELLNFREDLIKTDAETRMTIRYYESRISSPENILLLKPEASLLENRHKIPVLRLCKNRASGSDSIDAVPLILNIPDTRYCAFVINVAMVIVALFNLVAPYFI
ncbi:hypothetical protein ACOME3_001511 [Neoechinorhynchus agilis]